jgi:hypothetical protein
MSAQKFIAALFALIFCTVVSSTAVHAQALQSGIGSTYSMQPGFFIANLYIDVDASAKQLTVNTSGTDGDVNVFIRYATPFPQPGFDSLPTNYPVSEELLYRYSHYHAISTSANESIIITPSSRIPLGAGRWYITVINSSQTQTASGTITARTFSSPQSAGITVDFNSPTTDSSDASNNCETAPWTDSTPVTPTGSNPATTLGQARQNALTHATSLLSQQMQIPVPITVHACWAHLGGDANSAVLAHASPLTFLLDDPSSGGYVLPKRYTWYAITEAVRLGGTAQCSLLGGDCDGDVDEREQIEAVFNEDIGSSTVIGGESFYFGYDPDPNGNSLDFVTIAMHELTHGLGFIGLVNVDPTTGPIGARAGITSDSSGSSIGYQNLDFGPWDDIYDDFIAIVDSSNMAYTPFLSYEVTSAPRDAQRAAALVSGQDGAGDVPTLLRWSEQTAVESSVNEVSNLQPPRSFPSLYAPCHTGTSATCATVPGSTLSHTVQFDDLMNPIYPRPAPRTMGLALPMLAPLGWSNSTATMPTFAKPVSSSWYDRSRSGTGVDFRLVSHDANFGDVYFLTFYTYKADGTTEWYTAQGHLVDGVFLPDLDTNGNTLSRVIYHANETPRSTLDASVNGSVIVDFNQASNSPDCRNVDRSAASMLGVMHFSIGNDTGDWCIEPLVTQSARGTPDYNGVWYAGSNDSRWGFAVLYVNRGATSQAVIELYYPDSNGQPIWAFGNADSFANDVNIPLTHPTNGFCRTCSPPSGGLQNAQVGTISLHLTQATNEGGAPSGANKVTLSVSQPSGGTFSRSNVPITLLSIPGG